MSFARVGWSVSLLVLATTRGHAQSPASHPATMVSERIIDAHWRFLADDALEGRAAGSRGEWLAAQYIAAQFRRLGYTPAGDSGTYTQRFPLLRYRPGKPTTSAADSSALRFGVDFVARPTKGDTVVDMRLEAVFVGYGVVAPRYGRDDYRATDLRGKVAVVLTGNPLTIDSSRTLGTYYGEENYKRDEARRHGAVAVLFINHPARGAVRWDSVSRGYQNAAWLRDDPDPVRLVGRLNPVRAASLARGAGTSFEALARTADATTFRPKSLGTVGLATRGTIEQRLTASNVIGCLPGQDRQDEMVLLGGHYDHLGIGPAENGDSIYNGALDNASGTATLLGAVEALAASGARASRSVCFIAFSAEERGLLGSQAFVARERNPGRIVAMLNIDGANVWGRTSDIAVLGMDQSTLGEAFRRAASDEGLSVTVHPIEVRQRFYFRSDHLSFARVGIPSLFVRRGKELEEGGAARWQERFDEYYGTRYHKPGDNILPWHTTTGTAQQARVMLRVALDVANDPGRPTWVEASEFRGVASPLVP